MTEARRKARIAMLQKDITFEDLARQTGYSVATIHNLLSNTASTAKARQALTNALQTDELWPGVFMTERVITFVPGDSLEFSHESAAREWARDFNKLQPGIAVRRGRVVSYTQTCRFSLEIEDPTKRKAKKSEHQKGQQRHEKNAESQRCG